MDASFWKERWAAGSIGFHEGRPNTYLQRFVAHLDGYRRVFVPMCGKTEDLAFLASHGHEVIGVELVEDAVRAFFDEHGLVPARTQRGEHVEYAAGGITLLAGDVLTARPDLDAIYDRAALVALPPETRRRYAAHLRSLAHAGTRMLLVAFEYDQTKKAGPPFSVDDREVRELYAGATIEELAAGPDPRKWDEIAPIERCYAITF